MILGFFGSKCTVICRHPPAVIPAKAGTHLEISGWAPDQVRSQWGRDERSGKLYFVKMLGGASVIKEEEMTRFVFLEIIVQHMIFAYFYSV